MKSIFNKEIDQLMVTVNFVEKRLQKNYYILNNLKFEEKNMILYRNLYYLDLIIEKIKENFKEINLIRKLIRKKNLKKEVKRSLKMNAKIKGMACMILLKELTKLMSNYEFGNFDFEVHTIVSEQRDILMSNIPEKYKEKVLEEFAEIDFNYYYFLANEHLLEEFGWAKKAWRSVTRGVSKAANWVADKAKKAWEAAKRLAKKILDLAKAAYNKIKNFATRIFRNIGNFFKRIFNSIRKILGFFKKIAVFIFKNLFNFIKLMWKLLKGLMNFAIKWVPRFIKRTFTFLRYLSIKAKKTGAITIGLFFAMNIAMTKYWELLIGNVTIGDQDVTPLIPSQLIELPALFFTTHLFWTQTRTLTKVQSGIVNFFVKKIKIIKFFFTTILGMPNSRVFTARMPFKRRITMLGIYIKRNLTKFLLRMAIFIFALKLLIQYSFKNIIVEGIPDLRDFLAFPIILARFIIQLVLSIIF